MGFLQFVIGLVMLLDGLWNARIEADPVVPEQWEPTKANLVAVAQQFEVYRDQMKWQEGVSEDRLLLRLIPGCMGHDGNSLWDCVEAYNGKVWPPSKQPVGGYNIMWYSIPGVPSNVWLGATGGNFAGCKRLMAINVVLRYPHNPFYGTPLWIAVVAHEMYHADQSGLCNAYLPDVESAAVWGEYEALLNTWEAGGPWADTAYAALVYTMRRDAINTACYLMYKEGKDCKTELLPLLKLSRNEQAMLEKVNIGGILRNVPRYNLSFFQGLYEYYQAGDVEGLGFILENTATLKPVVLDGLATILRQAWEPAN